MKETVKHQNIRILKINTCQSLSGKSTFEYQIGSHGDADTYVRITKNSGGGWFSMEWLSLHKLIESLQTWKFPLTSFAVQTFFKGKSVNTAAFIFAALKEEGLVINDPDNPRCYLLQPMDNFKQAIQVLVNSGVALQDTGTETSKTSDSKMDDIIPVFPSSAKSPSGKAKRQEQKT